MQLHIDRLGPLNRLTIFFRSTAPGHPSCEQRLAPYADGADAREKEKNIPERMMAVTDDEAMKSTRRRWDWDQFAVHNEFWREEIKKLMEGRTTQLPRRDEEATQAEEGAIETRAAIPLLHGQAARVARYDSGGLPSPAVFLLRIRFANWPFLQMRQAVASQFFRRQLCVHDCMLPLFS